MAKVYRRVLEEGYNGLEELSYSKRDWTNEELVACAHTLQQVSKGGGRGRARALARLRVCERAALVALPRL